MSRTRMSPTPHAPWRALLAWLAFATAAATAQAAAPAQDSAALEAEVRRLVGSASCTADEQCRTIAFGAKACGGPQAYFAWSTLVTDAAALQAAADKHAARRRDELRADGRVSDCALVTDPGATCGAVAGGPAGQRACSLLGGAGGARSAR